MYSLAKGWVAGGITGCSSDERLQENVKTITNNKKYIG